MTPELEEFNRNRQGMFDDDVIASQLDPRQMIQLLKDAGWKETELQRAFEIAYLESKHRPLITHELKNEGEADIPSIGLFQITEVHAPQAEKKYGKKWRDTLKDPMENAKFALELYNQFGFKAWSANVRIENLLGYKFNNKLLDADGTLSTIYPSEHYYELGRNKQEGYHNTITDWNHAKDLYRDTGYSWLNPLKEKYKKESDGSYKFFNQVPTDQTTSSTPPSSEYVLPTPSIIPSQQEYANTISKNTSNVLAAGTDQVETDRFQPNFLKPDPKGGVMGAIENMRQ